jgi:hypothetical protein
MDINECVRVCELWGADNISNEGRMVVKEISNNCDEYAKRILTDLIIVKE